MADQSISCPSCGKKIPLTRALRAEIEASLKQQFDETLQDRERQLRAKYESRLEEDLQRAQADAAKKAEKKVAQELAGLKNQVKDQAKDLEDARRLELSMRKRERELERKQQEVELMVAREIDKERTRLVTETQERLADLHQVVIDPRGRKIGAIMWECKNTRNWSDGWIAKLKQDQRSLHADVAILVTATLPKGCARFALMEGVLVTDFACAAALAAVLRANLCQLAQTRSAAISKEESLELLYRYLSGVEFRHRVEAVVEAFTAMRHDLDQERRAAERQWARRSRQIDAVTFNVSGMYGDLQGLVPALPSIALLELPEAEDPILAAS